MRGQPLPQFPQMELGSSVLLPPPGTSCGGGLKLTQGVPAVPAALSLPQVVALGSGHSLALSPAAPSSASALSSGQSVLCCVLENQKPRCWAKRQCPEPADSTTGTASSPCYFLPRPQPQQGEASLSPNRAAAVGAGEGHAGGTGWSWVRHVAFGPPSCLGLLFAP